jgi:hypothetical protein
MPKSRVILQVPRIVHKDLSADNVWGYAAQEDFEVEIDPNQSQRQYLNTLIHETLHCMLPDLGEKQITIMANMLESIIWRKHYRRDLKYKPQIKR